MLYRANNALNEDLPENINEDVGSSDFRPTKKQIWCKNCKRRDYHFLAIRGQGNRILYRIVTLGTIALFGFYRCRCCGTRRIGSVDLFRGPDRPDSERSQVHGSDSSGFRREQRKLQIVRFLRALNPFRFSSSNDHGWNREKRRHRIRKYFSNLAFWRKSSMRHGFRKRR